MAKRLVNGEQFLLMRLQKCLVALENGTSMFEPGHCYQSPDHQQLLIEAPWTGDFGAPFVEKSGEFSVPETLICDIAAAACPLDCMPWTRSPKTAEIAFDRF
jgi:hypothetical protein